MVLRSMPSHNALRKASVAARMCAKLATTRPLSRPTITAGAAIPPERPGSMVKDQREVESVDGSSERANRRLQTFVPPRGTRLSPFPERTRPLDHDCR
jgi:hypothetical protein